MPYKISGTKNDTARIYIVNESDNTLETQTLISGSGSYEITNLTSGRKLVVARKNDGKGVAYGYVDSVDNSRGVFGGGYIGTGVFSNVIDYITISTTGNAAYFGDLTVSRSGLASCSSSTRGVFGGGYSGTSLNVIDYITLATTGNATDFGDLTVNKNLTSACSSSTRGVFGGGTIGGLPYLNVIDYITVSTTGNAIDFGDLTMTIAALSACSNGHGGLT